MVAEIDRLRKANESLGGVFEVQAFGPVPGLGSHVSWEQRLDGRLAMAICSIQALKGVSIGDGFHVAGLPGSQAHDEIFYDEQRGYYRESNRAGGLEGGMTNGQPLIVRGAMKPLPTLTKPLRSVDTATHAPAEALRERTDSCTVPAAGVVGEAMVALVLAGAYSPEVRRRPHRRRAAVRAGIPREDRVALVLIGFMGAGKSTLAGRLARLRGTQAIDSDALLSERFGHSVARELDLRGEESFRAAEEELVCALLDGAGTRDVIALGGGSILSGRVRKALAGHSTVLLDVDPVLAWGRVSAARDGSERPLARDREAFLALHAARSRAV